MNTITNNATMFLQVNGLLFKVLGICNSREDANAICKIWTTLGVLCEDKSDGRVYLCDMNDKGFKV